ncbi:MAG: enoyl-CoA hydratase/isomerase family protein [Microbacterium sp.]
MSDTPQPPVLASVHHDVGHLTLNRPRVINALDLDMIHRLTAALEAWRDDPAVATVILDGAGERGFCAGGDVRGLREQILTGRADLTAEFFRAEYALDAAIAEYPKPIVAIADGVTMGGGIGLAGHASIRVVTERSRLAMPETRIGFTPDVGGSWLLARAPGRVGEYLALTGETMDADDAVYAGFADHVVASGQVRRMREFLHEGLSLRRIVPLLGGDRARRDPGASRLESARAWIDDAFAADTVGGIISRLRARAEPGASATADTLERLSPTALTVTLAAVRAARELPDLRTALAQEYALVLWFAGTQPDLVEGIRAQLVDKDRTPSWRPASLALLDADLAARALAWAPPAPLWS